MLGAIIGDIAGSRWEFDPTNDYDFEFFSNENDYTDDTICTVAVADALLHGSDDYGGYLRKWCRRYPYPMGGYGGYFNKWVHNDEIGPYGSFGNGSAMRVSPIGWWFDAKDDVLREAGKTAACTHSHEEGVKGAQAVAIAIRDCRELRKNSGDKDLTQDDIFKDGLYNAISIYTNAPDDFRINLDECRNMFDDTCQGTVPVALWIVMHSTGFEDAVRKAVSLGADADTIGAITGSIAEALWGVPKQIEAAAIKYLPDEMIVVLKDFKAFIENNAR